MLGTEIGMVVVSQIGENTKAIYSITAPFVKGFRGFQPTAFHPSKFKLQKASIVPTIPELGTQIHAPLPTKRPLGAIVARARRPAVFEARQHEEDPH